MPKRIAIIGAGPAGAISLSALSKEKAFTLRVFERREGPGGCWIGDTTPPPPLTEFDALGSRTADRPLPIPPCLPAYTEKLNVPRYTESSVYPYLETNVEAIPMEFSAEPFPTETSELSRGLYGDTPFRHWKVVRGYVEEVLGDALGEAGGGIVSYGTTVERVVKEGEEWVVTLRKEEGNGDYWWSERFDGVVVANGHYWVPYVPGIPGLAELEEDRVGSVIHSKLFRGRDGYTGKRVVVVGASVSAADIAVDLVTTAEEVHAITIGRTFNGYFGGGAFEHPKIKNHPSIMRVDGPTRTVYLEDGGQIPNVDHIIFGTGYTWSLPFLPAVKVRNNRVPGLYQHVVWRDDPSLVFVGAVGAGLTFKIFEWQAVLAARLLAGRVTLPSMEEMERWELERIKTHGDGAKFLMVSPDFEQYFEEVRALAGPGEEEGGVGRRLPKFKREWVDAFMNGHEKRKGMWRRLNAAAEEAKAAGEVEKVEDVEEAKL